MQFTELSKNETLEIIGGKGKGAGSLWGMLGGSAFTHTLIKLEKDLKKDLKRMY